MASVMVAGSGGGEWRWWRSVAVAAGRCWWGCGAAAWVWAATRVAAAAATVTAGVSAATTAEAAV
eukprot:5230752-Prymnesium_polylepis.1